jgi:hypothetical protein
MHTDTSAADDLDNALAAARSALADLDSARTLNARAIAAMRLSDARARLRDAEAAYRADIELDPTAPTGRVHHLPFTPRVECWQGTALVLDDNDDALVTRANSGALAVGNLLDAR